MLTIIPAIDLKGGKCVRLRQGRAADETVYSADPVDVARRWEEQGAEFIHLVDLDGAFMGHPAHSEIIAAIAKAVSIPVELGGGLRTDAHIQHALSLGVRRVIVGTRILQHPDDTIRLVSLFGDRLVAGLDARDGMVQGAGWVQNSSVPVEDLARMVSEAGISTIIYTDIARDGMLQGANIEGVRKVCGKVSCDVVASGGVTSTHDVKGLVGLGCPNLKGAIVGKALYDGKTSLAELIQAARMEG